MSWSLIFFILLFKFHHFFEGDQIREKNRNKIYALKSLDKSGAVPVHSLQTWQLHKSKCSSIEHKLSRFWDAINKAINYLSFVNKFKCLGVQEAPLAKLEKYSKANLIFLQLIPNKRFWEKQVLKSQQIQKSKEIIDCKLNIFWDAIIKVLNL